MTPTCAVCGDKFTPSEEVCGECEHAMFAHDTREILEAALPAIAMQNLGAALALAGLAARLCDVNGPDLEDKWRIYLANRAGIAIPPAGTP